MKNLTFSWTFLLFSCSSILVLSGAGILEDVDTLSKETIDSDWSESGTALDLPGEDSSEEFYDSSERLDEQVDFNENTHHDIDKRPSIFSDNGYGSRLSAGSNIANDYLLLQKLFGSAGPGKRSGINTLYHGRVLFGSPEVLIKRDHGYGSRIRAGQNIADSLLARSVYGAFGPGRKRNSDNMKPNIIFNEKLRPWTQKRYLMSDSGYGSRIDAANKLARDLSVVDVFGKYGPGKK